MEELEEKARGILNSMYSRKKDSISFTNQLKNKKQDFYIIAILLEILEEIKKIKQPVVDEKEQVKEKLKKAGVKFSANTSLEKLKDKLKEVE